MSSLSVTGSTSMLASGNSTTMPRSCACHNRAAEPIKMRFPGCEMDRERCSSHSATWLPFFSSRLGMTSFGPLKSHRFDGRNYSLQQKIRSAAEQQYSQGQQEDDASG